MNTRYFRFAILLISLVYLPYTWAFTPFVVQDIQIEGLRRISPGTVFNYLPIGIGDKVDANKSSAAIAALFKTGIFLDVKLKHAANGVLIVELIERPAIAKINFEGNKELKTDNLKESLKKIGFAEGQVFNRSLLEKVEQEIQRLYLSHGNYSVKVESEVLPLVRNRVGVDIRISEGLVAKIKNISIVGNNEVSDRDLRRIMQLNTGRWFAILSKRDQYSREKLAGDVERIRAHYQDNGYTNFTLDSTQVSLSADSKDVYITINLTEGKRYTISDIQLIGNLIVPETELMELLEVKTGQIFSSKAINNSSEALSERIGKEGYFFANVNAIPDIDEIDNTVALKFFIEPGKRTYVRRINFAGNTRTRDEVLRREMRQMEAAWVSTSDIKRSKERLERLGYFEQVDVSTAMVDNSDDQIDITYNVIEMPSGSIMAGVGYSQTYGILFNASVVQDNFLGSGKRVGVSFNNSSYSTLYSISYFNPYTNIHGVGRNISLYFRETDAAEANLSRYATDAYGANISYIIPLSEYNSIRFGGILDRTKIKTTPYTANQVHDFIAKHGDVYHTYRATGSWSRDTRNRAIFADRGSMQAIGAEIAIPGSDLRYYKLDYRHHWLYPLTQDYTLFLKGEVGYGTGYGGGVLPFFENYTAGGPYSMRGFEENTLGPLDSYDRPFGGNLKTLATAEIILPAPFMDENPALRFSAFIDAGNVFGVDESFDFGKFRYSGGLSAIWMTPIGVITLSVAKALRKFEGDQTQVFQFAIGTNF
jgi:outer membrane protein insertion porin family